MRSRAIAGIATERRAVLTGEILDCASHRYDAWVTSLASVAARRDASGEKPGNQVGAWGAVRGVAAPRAGSRCRRPRTMPDGTQTDPQGGGFVMAPVAAPGEHRGRAARRVARARRRGRAARSRRSRSA